MKIREIYCPAHFGNSYEAMWPREMAACLAEMAYWGFNRYGDWLTTTDVRNPYGSTDTWSLAMELLDRKRKNFHAAQLLGLTPDLVVTANHVYLDQVRPEWAAAPGDRVMGQLICPSHPGARAVILGNFENWFRDMAAAGIRLGSFTAFAYDYGGCGCARCRPWILTFARLMREVHEIAERYHPGIEPWICSWWWKNEEHLLFNEWAAREAPGWLKGMTLHIEYDQTRVKDVDVPAGCRKLAFVHLGYSDIRGGNDIYAKYGPVVAPDRIPRTIRDLTAQGVEGFQGYSEGVFDDLNKALMAGLTGGRHPDREAVFADYAQRYFDAPATGVAAWQKWFLPWGDRSLVVLPEWSAEFERLAQQARPGWRIEHWRCKLELEELDRRIGRPSPGGWTPALKKLVEEYWATVETLQRHVYHLGPLRHIFAAKFSPPAWFDSWGNANAASMLPPEA